jgi:hypothetical protein
MCSREFFIKREISMCRFEKLSLADRTALIGKADLKFQTGNFRRRPRGAIEIDIVIGDNLFISADYRK